MSRSSDRPEESAHTEESYFPDQESSSRFKYNTMSNTTSRQESSGSEADKIVFEMFGIRLRLSQLKYISFMITGVALLWPWNCYLSASEYFTERFVLDSKLSNSYSSTMMTISTITSLVWNFVLSQRQLNVDYGKRLKDGQVMGILIFGIVGLSCVMLTDVNPTLYFIFIMATVLFSSLATCVSQNGTMALVNLLGPIYANGVMVGQAIAGVLPSITLIVSVLGSNISSKDAEERKSEKNFGVMFYFFTSCLVSVLSIVSYRLVEYFDEVDERYQELEQEQPISMIDNTQVKPDDATPPEIDEDWELQRSVANEHVKFSYLWSRLKSIVITIFLTFAVSLVFPVFASTVQSTNYNNHPDSALLNKNVYIPFIFLIWNAGDLVGRLVCAWDFFKVSDPRKLMVYSVARILFCPLFFLCNIKNNGAVVDSDLFYILLQFMFGFSNGQLCSSCFMDVTHFVEGENEQKAAGGFTAVFLSFGLAFGSVMSYIFVWMIN